jgi:hypothetical protein
MQFVSNIEAARGKLGGLVASAGRAGPQLRAQTMRTQPRSASQQNNRARAGPLAGAWRMLETAEQQSWNGLAKASDLGGSNGQPDYLSGYALFLRCNRNLQTIGVSPLQTAAPIAPSLPAIAGFSATPLYTGTSLPKLLYGFQLNATIGSGGTFAAVLRASAAYSPARRHIRPSELRIINVYTPWPALGTSIWQTWVAVYGLPPASGQVTFQLNLVDPLSGYAGPPVAAVAAYQSAPVQPPTPGSVTIEIEGVPIAILPNTEIEFEGEPVIGG